MIDVNGLYDIAAPIVTGVISAWGGWFFARKKYDAEVDNQKLENIDKAVQVYQKLLDDVNARLGESLEKNRKLEAEVSELRKQVFDLTMNICLDLSCTHRVKELKKNRKVKEEPQKA